MTEEKEGRETAVPVPAAAAAPIPPQYNLNSKWGNGIDSGLRRVVYSSLAGALTGLLFFRSPLTRWASVAFGAGIGLGSSYAECAPKFNRPAAKLSPNVSELAGSKE